MKISELNEHQKGHLAWLLDHKTFVGYGSATSIARGDQGDLELVDVFLKADKKPHIAKRYARQVEEFKIDEQQLKTQEVLKSFSLQILCMKQNHALSDPEVISILMGLKKFIRDEIERHKLFGEIEQERANAS